MSGLTGHINHLYEDPNLKLSDFIKIYRSISNNNGDFSFYEKVDGYNIYISYSVKDKKTKILRDRKSTRLNSSHIPLSRMPSSA